MLFSAARFNKAAASPIVLEKSFAGYKGISKTMSFPASSISNSTR
jgi:hypothetical protein